MNAVTLNDAKENLERLIEQTVENAEPTIIATDAGHKVVFMSLEEYNSWQETVYLLSNPANASHLARALGEVGAGKRVKSPRKSSREREALLR